MAHNIVNNSDYEQRTIQLLQGLDKKCSPIVVAKELNIAWASARAILDRLVSESKVEREELTRGFVYWIKKE